MPARCILTADFHLTDNPADVYRWHVFGELHKLLDRHQVPIYILGDLTHHRDNHSASLVNALVEEMLFLGQRVPVHILMGNHDAPRRNDAFWGFLSQLHNVLFYTGPSFNGHLLLLPYSSNAKKEWPLSWLEDAQTIFMHQTVDGAVAVGGYRLHGSVPLPTFSKRSKIYSGDVHVPQQVGNVTYVGAPHPVNFGDNYPCRLLVLGPEYSVEEEVILHPEQKRIVEIDSVNALYDQNLRPGDQVRIRFHLSAVEHWPEQQAELRTVANAMKLQVASVETVLQGAPAVEPQRPVALAVDPASVLRNFCSAQSIASDVADTGQRLLQATLQMGQ